MAIADINSILSRSFRNDRISKISWEKGNYLNVTMCVTEECNLECTYCYMVGKNNFKKMTFETAKKIVDFIVNDPYCNSLSDKKYIHKDSRFSPITEYLKGQDREIELDFSKVEELIGRKLCKSARTYPSYWYASEDRPMGNSIYNAGYDIVKVDVKKETIRLINYDK